MDTREQMEARAKELGLTFPANISDEKLGKKIEAAQSAAQSDAEDGFVTVRCAIAGGRRRGGRAFDGGDTKVPVKEFTKELADALARDPLFFVVLPA